jgi:hypothetical protein
MVNVAFLAILFTVISLLSGCSQCQPVQPLYVKGDVSAKVGPHCTLLRAKVNRDSRNIVLERPGDSQCIEEDEPFNLSMPRSIDMAEYAIQIEECDEITAGKKRHKISLVETCQKVLMISKHCQRINWYNPYRIPEIRIDNRELDQLVVTPLLGRGNSIVGYEVRLGDANGPNKCKSPALEALTRVQRTGTIMKPPPSRTKKNPDTPELFLVFEPIG